jgi:hypothetical protein
MRETLKLIRTAIVATLVNGCGSTKPRQAEPIPPELIPDGFTAADCRHIDETPQDSGGISSVGAGMDAAAQSKHHLQVECHHMDAILPATSVCRDDAGNNVPLEKCMAKPK